MQAASKDTLQSIHAFLQLGEAIKLYAKLLRGAKMETLTTEWLPRFFLGQGGEDRDF